jgi:tetratricopeptide (TPR) repeat protein
LALALRRSGKPDAALRECAVARHLNPNIPRIGLEEALCYHDMAEFTAALAKLDAVLAAYPTYARARRFKAEILEEIERFEDAVEEWSHMAGNNPADPYLQASLGEALMKAGKPAAALGCLEMAARMAPDSPKIQLTFAREAMTQRRFDLAQEVVEQASPRASTPQSRLQFIEFRFLLALKLGRWSALVPLLSDLKGILEGNPDIIPLDKDLEFDGEMLLSLGLGKDAAKIYSGLVELFEGTTDYDLFDELVTDVMRSLLPPKPKPIPLPEPAIREEQPSLAALNEPALAGPPEKPESAPLETGQETDLRETPSPESTSQAAGEPAEPESQDSATVSLGQIPGDVPAPEETAEAVIPKGKKKQSKKKKRGVSP